MQPEASSRPRVSVIGATVSPIAQTDGWGGLCRKIRSVEVGPVYLLTWQACRLCPDLDIEMVAAVCTTRGLGHEGV